MNTKQSIESCLKEYTDQELIEFHANLNALFLCCTTDFKLFPLLLQVHFTIAARNKPLTKKYLQAVDKMMNMPEKHKTEHYKKSLLVS